MTDNIITARLFIDMDGTLAAWQQAACFEDLLQENYFRDLPPYQTVVDATRIPNLISMRCPHSCRRTLLR